MNDPNYLDQVRRDLDVIRSAAGFGQPPLGREDVHMFRFLGILGWAWSVVALIAGGLPLEWFSIYALGVSVVGLTVYRFQMKRLREPTVMRERVYRNSWPLAAILGVLIGGFFIWARFGAELTGGVFLGATLIYSGGLLAILAITDRWRLLFWGWAVPVLALGAVVQRMSENALGICFGAVIGVGGIASAEIVSWQLRAAKRENDGSTRV